MAPSCFFCRINTFIVCIQLLVLPANSFAQQQQNPTMVDKHRLNAVIITESAISTIGLAGLNYLWYRKFSHSRFHFFNDGNEWLNMDKMGHATTAYNISAIQYNMMRWSGVGNKQSIWIGGLTSMGFQTLIEIFDGFSQKWGFSVPDMLANIAGSSLFMAQQFAFNEQRVQLKFSFHYTPFAVYNPSELGKSKWQRWLKDYNGQTYWLSVNPGSFMKSSTDFPKWLNVAFGYGAEGMIGASANPVFINNREIPPLKRYRQYYLSIDGDLQRMRSNNITSGALLAVPGIIKWPLPAVEFSKTTPVKFHWIAF